VPPRRQLAVQTDALPLREDPLSALEIEGDVE
jgi:hypothetical protein